MGQTDGRKDARPLGLRNPRAASLTLSFRGVSVRLGECEYRSGTIEVQQELSEKTLLGQPTGHSTIRYDTRCYFNVRSKADISTARNRQLKKCKNRKKTKK